MLHISVSTLLPTQSFPLLFGSGNIQVLYLVIVPPPHVFEQIPGPYSVQTPSTAMVHDQHLEKNVKHYLPGTVSDKY